MAVSGLSQPLDRAFAVIAISTLIHACTVAQSETPTRPIRIMTSNPSAEYYAIGEVLSRVYNDSIPDVHASVVPSLGGNVTAIEEGSAELAFASAQVAYEAFVRGTPAKSQSHRRLRGIAVVFTGAVQIVVPANSRLKKVADLRGARVGLSVATPETQSRMPGGRSKLVELVAAAHGLSAEDIQLVLGTSDEVREAMAARTIDAWFVLAGYPLAKVSGLYGEEGIRLLEIGPNAASYVRSKVAFYKPIVIPGGTYPGQATAVKTIGSESLLVCRDDLDDQLVYRITKGFFEALPRLTEAHSAMRFVDPNFASATPIPLHAGAAQYYRESQLLQ